MKSNLKKYLIFNICLFLNIIISYSQVIPYSFVRNKSFVNSFYKEASFKIYSTNVAIKSDFNWNFDNTKPYTIQFHFKFNSYLFTEGKSFLGFANMNNNEPDIYFMKYELDPNYLKIRNFISFNYLNKDITDIGSSPVALLLKLNTTYHFTTTYDGAIWRNYRNGELLNSTQNTSTWNGSGNLIIGNRDSEKNFSIDEIRFWDRALSPSEIALNWNKMISGYENGLQVYYNFDHQGYPNSNNSKNIYLNDITPNNHKGTFLNINLIGFDNNFVPTITNSFTLNGYLNYPIFSFNATNIDSYPGTNQNNNPLSNEKWYNLNGFNNSLEFYTTADYNVSSSPKYFEDGIRSIGINNIYGKTNTNYNISIDSSLSIEAWVKFNTNNNNSIVKIGANTERNKFEIGVTSNKFSINIGGNHSLLSNNSMISNKWYHLTYVYSNKTLKYKIYINGILDKEEWIDPILGYVEDPVNFWEGFVGVRHNITNTPIYIGTSETPFNGKLGLLNVYDRDLSESEIQKRFRVSKSRFGY
jgi:hypothetical protein